MGSTCRSGNVHPSSAETLIKACAAAGLGQDEAKELVFLRGERGKWILLIW
jgi:hypothetical protein